MQQKHLQLRDELPQAAWRGHRKLDDTHVELLGDVG